MSYNGSGTFNINSAGQPVVTGTVITSTAFNALTADLATGLSTALTKDGQTTPTANIPMGTYKITGLGAGTVATDAVRFSQLQNGSTTTYITAAGTDTITGTVTPTLTAYATGQQFSFVVAATNTTAVTLNVDGVGAKAVTRTGSVALVAGDMVTGQVVIVEYDGTRFQLINGNSFTNLKASGTLGVTGAATLSSTLAVAGALNASSGSVFRKNAIINGDFMVWQEGTSFAAAVNGQYSADMWAYSFVGAMVHTLSRSTDVPTIAEAGRKILYSLLVDCTTVEASIAATDCASIYTIVEGYNFNYIAGVGLCLQFWHKHTKTGTYCVAFRNENTVDRSFIREYTQAVTNTWEFASVLVDASPSAGNWNYTTGRGLQVYFMLACGSTYQTTAGAWNTGNFLGTSNQVNACDSTANNFMLAGVQLEKGSVATEFDARSFGEELELCQRYYCKTFAYATAPAQNVGSLNGCLTSPSVFNVFVADTRWAFPVEMRSAPTIVTFNPTQANADWRNEGNTADSTVVANTATTTSVRIDGTNVVTAGPYLIHATASARF